MHPVLFELNGFQIHTYGVMGALGFLFVAFTALLRTRALGLKPERVADLIFVSAIAGLIGARVVFVLQNPETVDSVWGWFNLRSGGLVFYGALLVGAPVAAGMVRWLRFPFFATWDVFAAAFPIAHGLSRLGCYAAGCCFGTPTDQPWGVVFTDPRVAAPLHQSLHPTQLYEAFGLFVLGAGLNVLYARKGWHGRVMMTYLLGYAVLRMTVEMFRGDASRGFFLPSVFHGWLSWSQGISLGMATFGILVFGVLARRLQATE